MNNDYSYYRRWIQDIARDILATKCPVGIVEHIQKHAVLDLNRHVAAGSQPEDMMRWAASMHNLLRIFEEVYAVYPTTANKLERLLSHYERNQEIRTPPPTM